MLRAVPLTTRNSSMLFVNQRQFVFFLSENVDLSGTCEIAYSLVSPEEAEESDRQIEQVIEDDDDDQEDKEEVKCCCCCCWVHICSVLLVHASCNDSAVVVVVVFVMSVLQPLPPLSGTMHLFSRPHCSTRLTFP